jgi:lysophospholipase L1-like esterase
MEYNELLQSLAEEKQVYYLDTKSAVADKNGSLPENAAVDGIHLVKEYCGKWLEYLKLHTITQ